MPCFSAALSFDCWGKKTIIIKKETLLCFFFVLFLFCFLLCLFVFTTHLIYHEAIHTCSLCSARSLPPHPCNIYYASITTVTENLSVWGFNNWLVFGRLKRAFPAPSFLCGEEALGDFCHRHGHESFFPHLFSSTTFPSYICMKWLMSIFTCHYSGWRKGEWHQLCVGGFLLFIPYCLHACGPLWENRAAHVDLSNMGKDCYNHIINPYHCV